MYKWGQGGLFISNLLVLCLACVSVSSGRDEIENESVLGVLLIAASTGGVLLSLMVVMVDTLRTQRKGRSDIAEEVVLEAPMLGRQLSSGGGARAGGGAGAGGVAAGASVDGSLFPCCRLQKSTSE